MDLRQRTASETTPAPPSRDRLRPKPSVCKPSYIEKALLRPGTPSAQPPCQGQFSLRRFTSRLHQLVSEGTPHTLRESLGEFSTPSCPRNSLPRHVAVSCQPWRAEDHPQGTHRRTPEGAAASKATAPTTGQALGVAQSSPWRSDNDYYYDSLTPAHDQPVITSPEHHLMLNEGDNVVLPCAVTNLGGSTVSYGGAADKYYGSCRKNPREIYNSTRSSWSSSPLTVVRMRQFSPHWSKVVLLSGLHRTGLG
ncbi:hypothetical protein GWK47_019080 [Chionoecetes opilio]|uniref:Uncharacterized protein n=1 Tax=Chionoecetes opilio TaxID=41210 RepID=A0A8J5CG46_CHIOP|nr:hypothetical protein GWK47_019080 [Chionoecetes opilio]